MVRFKKFIDKALNVKNVRDPDRLQSFGVECTYLPDPVEDFDEFEFKTDFEGQEIIIGFAVEMGKIKRLMFVVPKPDNPEIVKALTEEELDGFLCAKGEQMQNFYEFITN